MKHPVELSVVLAMSVAAPALSHAQSDRMKGMDMKGMDMKGMDMKGMDSNASAKRAKNATHKGTGTVRKSDPAGGTVTIAHDPIKSMEWPAMTMSFTAKEKKMLEGIKPGAKVEFEFVQQESKYTITSIK